MDGKVTAKFDDTYLDETLRVPEHSGRPLPIDVQVGGGLVEVSVWPGSWNKRDAARKAGPFVMKKSIDQERLEDAQQRLAVAQRGLDVR
jgi:hypothetical protein